MRPYVARGLHEGEDGFMARTQSRRGWGRLRKLGSGRYQAGYTGPDLRVHYGPTTFQTKIDAEGWLITERRMIERGDWVAPPDRNQVKERLLLRGYATSWLEGRELKPRTRALYEGILSRTILPALGDHELPDITPAKVRAWHATLPASKPTARAHAYSLLRTLMNSAVAEDLIETNPCRITGAGASKRVHKIEPASFEELEAIVEAMTPHYRAAVLLAAWCSLRFGELAELRRGDLDMRSGVVKIRRGVVQLKGGRVVGTPKSSAGVRDVVMPPHIRPAVSEHLAQFTGRGKDALVFTGETGGYVAHSVLRRRFQAACEAAGRPDLRWHDLRHTGAVLAAQAGATLPELMNRLGHSTVSAAMRYQHAARDRDAEVAAAMSRRVGT